MIRFIFVALFLFLYLILGIPVYLILRLICKINKKAGDCASVRGDDHHLPGGKACI